MFFRRKNIRPYEKASVIVAALFLSPAGGSKISGRRTSRAAVGILVALASEFWGLGCPRIYNEVATLSFNFSQFSFKLIGAHIAKI